MTELEILKIEYSKLRGDLTGTLKGIVSWNIPKELKDKVNKKIKELENSK
jgi:hypothetical protein